jgi:hypothetical protein
MTSQQVRYFNRKTKRTHVQRLLQEVSDHPFKDELIALLGDQVRDDTHKVVPQVVYI